MEKQKKNNDAQAQPVQTPSEAEHQEEVLNDGTEVTITLEQLQEELAKQNDLLLRTAAEYDNFKKRTQREKEELSNFTKCFVLKELLPALDNFERAAAADNENLEEYKKGMDMSVKMLMDILQKLGLSEIDCEGKTFDPDFHYAVSKIDDEALGENQIAQVYQKGYTLGETVVRHAMVVVANCN